MTLILLAFFFAYYVYEPPYRGLYPDLLPQSEYGRAQGVQHLLRGLAIGVGPDRRRAPLRRLAPGAVPDHRVRHGRGVRRGDRLRARAAGRDEPRLRGRARVRRAQHAHPARRAGGAPLPRLQLGVGGDVRGRAVLRRPLHHEGAGRVRRRSAPRCSRRSRAATSSRRRGPGWVGDRLGLARVIYYCSFVYGGGLLVGGPRAAVARLVPRADLPRRDRRRGGHDARVGPALQADAAASTAARSPGSRRRRRASA